MIKNNRLTYGMLSNNSLSDVFIDNFVYMFGTIFTYNFGYVFAGQVFQKVRESINNPANIYLFKTNNINTRVMYKTFVENQH